MSLQRTLYTAEQVQAIEHYAFDELGIPSYDLMQSAAHRCFAEIKVRYPAAKTISIFCGIGNNGGDGYAIAQLALKENLKVRVFQLGKSNNIKGDALTARNTFIAAGGDVSAFETNELCAVDIIIDAIFGIGLSREISGEYLQAVNAINDHKQSFPETKVLAVDMPSGLAANTGIIFGCCIQADICISFVGLKRGLFTGQARDYVGEIVFDNLKIPTKAYQQLNLTRSTQIISGNILQTALKPRRKCSHKGDFGHVLLIGGGEGMNGAIRLAAEAALRCGAGLVSVATHPSHATSLNIGRAEIMVHSIAQADAVKPLLEKATVIVIGPGLGMSDWSRELLELTKASDKPTVIDADALNLLAEPEQKTYKNNWILTPHPKEMSRLLHCTTAEIEADRYKHVEICPKSGGVSILKGAGTLIADLNQTMVCTEGNPGMSSGGMGDVLTGVIAALLAQGLSLFDAASAGVYLHARAADSAAMEGERGLLASDLLPHLRALVNNKAIA